MQWYKHDTNATNDAKIKKLIIRHGAVGYAIYFHCLELIAGDLSENNITFCLEHDSEIIADNLKIQGTPEKSGMQIVEEIMHYILELDLFQERNNHIYCYKLLKRLDSSMTSSPKFRQIISDAKQSHDLVMTESCKIRIDKNRIDKNRKEKKRLTVPSLNDILSYISDNSLSVDGAFFLKYYTESNWIDTNGKKVINWKLKLLTWDKQNKTRKQKELDKRTGIDYPEL